MSETATTEVKEEVKETIKAPIKKAVTAFKVFLSAQELEAGQARLTTFFRCEDRTCPAHAAVEFAFRNGGHLYYCLHHAREMEPVLKPFLKKRGGYYSEEIRFTHNRLQGSEN